MGDLEKKKNPERSETQEKGHNLKISEQLLAATRGGLRASEELERISEQGAVISFVTEIILLIVSDSIFPAYSLLLFVDSVEIPHNNQRQQ